MKISVFLTIDLKKLSNDIRFENIKWFDDDLQLDKYIRKNDLRLNQ